MKSIEHITQLTHKNTQNFYILADIIPQIVWTANPNGWLDYYNQRWFDYTGMIQEPTQIEEWEPVLHPDDLHRFMECWKQTIQTGKGYEIEYRLKRAADGVYRWHLRQVIPLHDSEGNIIKWLGTCTDIHDLKQTESILKATTEHFELALESAQAGIWNWDIINNEIKWDKRTYELFHLEMDSLTKYKNFIVNVHPEDRLQVDNSVKKTLVDANNCNYDNEYRIIWPDGSIHVISSHGKSYFNKEGKPTHMIGVCWDVTKEKETELRLRQLQIELSRVARINAMGEMASALAHELNQPLTTISTYAQLYALKIEQNNYSLPELLNALQQIAKQSERAGNITHRIKDFAHHGTLYLELVDLNTVVQEAIEFIYYEKFSLLSKIQFELNTTLPLVSIDRIQIQQVIINLVKNSIEAVQSTETSDTYIGIITDRINDAIVVTITDNGPGIPAELHEKIFELYFTTKLSGMGIGLTICRTIIEAHGGHLTFHPAPGNTGACFTFTLPLRG